MPPKKASKPNAFILFAQELQQQHGRKYNSLKDACDGAAPLWARMSKEERQPYDVRAKGLKGHNAKYTSEGINVDVLTKEEMLKAQSEEHARQEIRNMLSMANRNSVLDTEVFFVIHCNIFCYYPNEDRYYPAEIAVICFTLKDGVKTENIFHFTVNPGLLPIGYKFEAKQHSDETHMISVPFDDDQIDNQEEVYWTLKAFLEKKKPAGTKRMPILYAENKYMKVVQKILDYWAEYYDTETDLFRVYSLQVMFLALRNMVACEQAWSSVTFADRELEKDVYDYHSEIACQYHSSTPRPKFCSKSIVSRYVYVICDNCCSELNIEYIEGQHVPLHSDVPDSVSTYGSISSRSSQSEQSSRQGFDNDFETESNTDWETESLASNVSTSTLMSGFEDRSPLLAKSRSDAQTLSNSAAANSSSVKSYAGATVNSLPNAFEKNMSGLSLNSGRGSRGRGFSRRINDNESPTSPASGAGSSSYANTTSSDWPPIGRGFAPRAHKKPGAQNN